MGAEPRLRRRRIHHAQTGVDPHETPNRLKKSVQSSRFLKVSRGDGPAEGDQWGRIEAGKDAVPGVGSGDHRLAGPLVDAEADDKARRR